MVGYFDWPIAVVLKNKSGIKCFVGLMIRQTLHPVSTHEQSDDEEGVRTKRAAKSVILVAAVRLSTHLLSEHYEGGTRELLMLGSKPISRRDHNQVGLVPASITTASRGASDPTIPEGLSCKAPK